MNVRKLLARLNVKSCRLDIGAGGKADLTDQDIAAALGMLRNTLARDILCIAWWPDGVEGSRDTITAAVRMEMMREYGRRHRAAQVAKLELHMIECEYAARHAHTRDDERERSRAFGAVDATKSALWPSNMAMYPLIAKAVLREIAAPRQCSTCGGRGFTQAEAARIMCHRCAGDGLRGQSNVWRAQQLGDMDEGTYRSTWRAVYEWTYGVVEALERTAAMQLARAIGKEEGDGDEVHNKTKVA